MIVVYNPGDCPYRDGNKAYGTEKIFFAKKFFFENETINRELPIQYLEIKRKKMKESSR